MTVAAVKKTTGSRAMEEGFLWTLLSLDSRTLICSQGQRLSFTSYAAPLSMTPNHGPIGIPFYTHTNPNRWLVFVLRLVET